MVNLRKATIDDWKTLLDWRNDISTRKYSHNTTLVKEEEHKKWLQSVLDNENRELYLYLENGIPAGTVRADWDKNIESYELSWTVSPEFRRQGIGKKMVKQLADKYIGKLRAEIKSDNKASIKIAEFAGLKLEYENNNILHFVKHKK